jgi:subtilase family serine protease
MLKAREHYHKKLSSKKEPKENVVRSHLKPHVASNSSTNIPPQYFSGPQLTNLYNIPSVLPSTPNTRRVKIAVIVAFSYPKLKADLATYWKNDINFGANSTPPAINVYTMKGATYNAEWAQEECLDVQMVCTFNPNATIWVVEAASDNLTDLIAAIFYATETLKVDVVSMSWGTDDTQATVPFNTNYVNPNVCYCASTGDTGEVSWPAVSPNCIAVGGTTLIWTPNTNPTRKEYCWIDAGCGYSCTIMQPNYQSGIANIKHDYRAIPDLSLIASTKTSAYTVFNGNWYGVGGTSVSTPIFASILSLANQMRFNTNKGPLTTVYNLTPNTVVPINYKPPPNNLQTYLYKTIYTNPTNYANAFYDVTLGSDKGSVGGTSNDTTIYNAGTKFDIATGLGSPNVTNLCNQLLNIKDI